MNYRNAYNAIYGPVCPHFNMSEETIKVSHTSLKKLEKEDFNSINRYFISSLGTRRPQVRMRPPQVRTLPQRTYIYA